MKQTISQLARKLQLPQLDSPQAVQQALNIFTSHFTRQDLFIAAEDHLTLDCTAYAYRHANGGLMRTIIRLLLVSAIAQSAPPERRQALYIQEDLREDLEAAIMEHYKLTPDTVPPRLLLKEAIALQVKLSSYLADLAREASSSCAKDCDKDWGKDWGKVVRNAASELAAPEDAFKLSREELDALLACDEA